MAQQQNVLILYQTSNSCQQYSRLIIMKQSSNNNNYSSRTRKQRDHLEIFNRSDPPSKIEHIANIKQEEEQYLPHDIQEQLELNIEKYSYEIKDELRYLLMDLLRYPSINAAIRHSYANRLGYNDLKHIKNKYNQESTYVSSRYRTDHCEDCGLLIQQRQIPLCSSIWQFPKVGVATYLLFRNMKVIMTMLFFLGAIFSIVSLYINVNIISIITSSGTTLSLDLDFSSFAILFSNGLKVTYSSTTSVILLLFQLQALLLILVILVWWFGKYVVECTSQKYIRIVDQASLTASDFSIMLENVPIHYSKQKLQEDLNRYFQSLMFRHNIKNTWGQVIQPFTIRKICQTVPFSLNESDVLDRELEGLDHDIEEKKKLFASWVEQMKVNSRFTYTKSQRQRQYIIFEKMLERRQNKIEQMQRRAQQQYQRANKNITSTVFVTFHYNQTADIIEDLNPHDLPSKIRYYLSFKKSTQYFNIRDFKINEQAEIIASRAPQPEDIIWGNVAVPLKILILRKIVVWLVIILLLGACFGAVYGLSFVQSSGVSTWPSIAIGFAIAFFNILIKFVLRKISPYEKDFTQTERQRGILLKGLLVMAFNWTVPLAVTNVFNQSSNFYSTNGYAEEVIWIGIFQAILPPIVRIFDPEHFIKKIARCWKSRPYNKIILKQSELNSYYQHEQYELGYSYMYFFNILFLNTFYINLQPGIVIPPLIGSFLMYWVQKFCLINRSQRPQKSAKTLTKTVQSLFSFVPIILWVGHIVWVNTMLSDFSSIIFTIDLVLMGLSIGYFITPWRSLYSCFCHIPQQEILDFQTCRIKLPTQYDRLNPASIEAGLADYLQHLNEKRKEETNHLNKSQDNLLQNYNTQYVIQEISKLPSIFGRKNDVSRKIDKNDLIRRTIKGEDIEVVVTPHYNEPLNESIVRSMRQSNLKVQVNKREGSPQPNRYQTQEDLLQEDVQFNQKRKERYADSQIKISPQKDKRQILNMSSNGKTFGKKKGLNQKRKTISVLETQQNYQFQNMSSKL